MIAKGMRITKLDYDWDTEIQSINNLFSNDYLNCNLNLEFVSKTIDSQEVSSKHTGHFVDAHLRKWFMRRALVNRESACSGAIWVPISVSPICLADSVLNQSAERSLNRGSTRRNVVRYRGHWVRYTHKLRRLTVVGVSHLPVIIRLGKI